MRVRLSASAASWCVLRTHGPCLAGSLARQANQDNRRARGWLTRTAITGQSPGLLAILRLSCNTAAPCAALPRPCTPFPGLRGCAGSALGACGGGWVGTARGRFGRDERERPDPMAGHSITASRAARYKDRLGTCARRPESHARLLTGSSRLTRKGKSRLCRAWPRPSRARSRAAHGRAPRPATR